MSSRVRRRLLAAVGRQTIYDDVIGVVMICLVALAAVPEGSESPTKAVRGIVIQVISGLEDLASLMPTTAC